MDIITESKKPIVVLESPFKGNGIKGDSVELFKDYAKQCLAHSLSQGEAPFASHLLYTQVLDDNVEEERIEGIEAGLSFLSVADKHVFYIDYGISEGMFQALQLTLDKINKLNPKYKLNPKFYEEGGVDTTKIPLLEFRKIIE